jgi:hypothetical protein
MLINTYDMAWGVHMVSKPMARIMARFKIKLVRPQLKHRASKPLILTNCHEQEEQGANHEGKTLTRI